MISGWWAGISAAVGLTAGVPAATGLTAIGRAPAAGAPCGKSARDSLPPEQVEGAKATTRRSPKGVHKKPTEEDMRKAVERLRPGPGKKGESQKAVLADTPSISKWTLQRAVAIHRKAEEGGHPCGPLVQSQGRPPIASPAVMDQLKKNEFLDSLRGDSIWPVPGKDIQSRLASAVHSVSRAFGFVLNSRALFSKRQWSTSALFRLKKKIAPLSINGANVKSIRRYNSLKKHFGQLSYFCVYKINAGTGAIPSDV